MLNRFLLLVFIVLSLYLTGCMDAGTATDSFPPQVGLNSPKSFDTLQVGNNNISYWVYDDQGINRLDLYLDSIFVQSYSFPTDGSYPKIYLHVDSTKINKRVSYFMIAYDMSGNSTKSNTMYNLIVVKSTSLPPAPFGLSLVRLSQNLVNLAWQDSASSVNGYELWRKEGSNGVYQKIRDIPAGSFNTNDQLPYSTVTYFYKIRSYNSAGKSPYSNETSTSGSGGSGSVIAPSNLKATALGTSKVLLTWQDNSNNENYFRIERKTSWSDFQQVGVVPFNTTSFRDSSSGLSTGNDYYYRVKVFSSNDSAASSEVLVRTLAFEPPTNLQAMVFNSKTIRLTWTNNNSYQLQIIVERKVGASGNWTTLGTVSSTPAQYDDATVQPGTTYYYRIKGSDGINTSDYTNEAVVTAQIVSLFPPTNLNAFYNGASLIKLSWTDNSPNESGFIIERRDSTANTQFTKIAETASGIVTYDDYSTVSQHIYIYRVAATDGLVNSIYSNQAIVFRP
jgi:hypothetical protein